MFSQRNNPYCDLLYFRAAKIIHFFHIQANKKIFIFVSYYKCLCLRMYVLKYFFTFFIYPIKYKAGKTKLSRCFWVFCGSFTPSFRYLNMVCVSKCCYVKICNSTATEVQYYCINHAVGPLKLP